MLVILISTFLRIQNLKATFTETVCLLTPGATKETFIFVTGVSFPLFVYIIYVISDDVSAMPETADATIPAFRNL